MNIEKGIPMTPISRKFGESKYPFPKMDVGDSFLVKAEEAKNARTAAYCYGSRNGMRFSCRKVGADYRIWRTA